MSSAEDSTVSEHVTAALSTVRRRVTVNELKRLIHATISLDPVLRPLLGVVVSGGVVQGDSRVYPAYAAPALIDATHRAYVTYMMTAHPEETQAIGEPVFSLLPWAISWDVADQVRDRLVDLFDEREHTTNRGTVLYTNRLNEHDNFQEDTKFASIALQFRFGFSRV